MSKGFNYSKWDNIELSDDEEDVHPNIDRESWFRMKHRSRVEREEHEDKDKKRILGEVSMNTFVCADADGYLFLSGGCISTDYLNE
jgi:hypothetical protein